MFNFFNCLKGFQKLDQKVLFSGHAFWSVKEFLSGWSKSLKDFDWPEIIDKDFNQPERIDKDFDQPERNSFTDQKAWPENKTFWSNFWKPFRQLIS